jgi:hypothetical protein
MITHLIPICFLGGSGGIFLSTWISQASDSLTPLIEFSKHGNAHLYKSKNKPKTCIFNMFSDQDVAIENLKLYDSELTVRTFTECHLINDAQILENFNTCIKIYFDADDVSDIAYSFVGKHCIDEVGSAADDVATLTKQFQDRILIMTDRFVGFTKPLPVREGALSVSWKELVHLDEVALINKLSEFLSIDAAKFDAASLLKWRKITIAGIASIKSLIG